MLRNALLISTVLWFGVGHCAGVPQADLTITVDKDLLKYGGVVTVYPIPVSAKTWADIGGEDAQTAIRLDSRYSKVQLRYPQGGKFSYRFRPVDGTPHANAHATQVLSIIGVDQDDRGPLMTEGFKNAYSSGGRIIRVPPMAELAGGDDATKTNARWGVTERYDEPPPADHRSARALVAIVEYVPQRLPLQCQGGKRVQVCTIADDQWPALEARWWRAIAEQRLERLRDRALRSCYDSNRSLFGGGTCVADPESDEPVYFYRK